MAWVSSGIVLDDLLEASFGSSDLSASSSEDSSLAGYLVNLLDKQNYSTLLMGKSPGEEREDFTQHRTPQVNGTTTDSTMYLEYPPTKPFINDDYERPSHKPVSAYPEGNRKAVINALKNLQEKIHQLEVERSAAEDNLKSLATETNRYCDILQKDSEKRQPKQTHVSQQNQELEVQLSAAETRCGLLEKQLENMKHMVETADRQKPDVYRKTVEFADISRDEPTSGSGSSHFQENLQKIADLERQHIRLTANQSLAESKIRELEEKLGEERHHRRLMVEKTSEIDSARKATQILQDAGVGGDPQPDLYKPVPVAQKPKKLGKKKKKVVSKKTAGSNNHKADNGKHYRLNLADIPFVAGKNTGPSHSVGANVQRVFSLMKNHNMALCSRTSGACPTSGSPGGGGHMSPGGSDSPTSENELADILLQLQDEFHQMSFEHQEFSKEICETSDPRVREDLERELDALVARMEAKSQQIARIRKYQEKLASKKKKKKAPRPDDFDTCSPRPKSAPNRSPSPHARRSPRYNGEVEVTTTIKSKGTGSGVVQIRPTSAREISLNVLKDMKKLQSTLRKDDLVWK